MFWTRESKSGSLNFTKSGAWLDPSTWQKCNPERKTTNSTPLVKWFWAIRGCLVYVFKQQFLVFKQHFTHFNALFHPHVFPQIFLNNNFQFLNTHTKQALRLTLGSIWVPFSFSFFFLFFYALFWRVYKIIPLLV